MVWDFAPLMDIPPQSPGYRGCVTGRPGSAVYAAAHPPNRLKRFFHHWAAQPKCFLPSPLQDQQSVPPFFSHTARPFAAPCGFFPTPPSHFPCGGPCTFAFSNFLHFGIIFSPPSSCTPCSGSYCCIRCPLSLTASDRSGGRIRSALPPCRYCVYRFYI